MSETNILSSLRTTLDSVAGLNEVLARPPDAIGALPAAWITIDGADVVMGALEVWTWRLNVTVVVARTNIYAMEQAALEPYRASIMDAIRANYTLNGSTYGLNVTSYRLGTMNIGGSDYAGFTLSLSVKEKSATSLTG